MRAIRNTIVFLLGAVLVAGCGGASTGEVSGTITYDGKPLEEGAIKFIPVDGNAPSAGGTIKDGKYTATKVPVGAAKVSIYGVKVLERKMAYDDPKAKAPTVQTGTELLPAKYNENTELRYDVKSGTQTKDFDLAK